MSDTNINFGLTISEKDRLLDKARRMSIAGPNTSISILMRTAIPLLLELDEDPGWSKRFISHVSSTNADSLFADNTPPMVTVAAPVPKRLADDFAVQVKEDGGFQYPAHALARALLLFSLPSVVSEVAERLKGSTPSKNNVQGLEEILRGHRYCYTEARHAIDELRRKADDASRRLEVWDDDFVQAGKKTGGTWAKGIEYMLEAREAEKRMQDLYNKPTKKGEKS